jgi:hypothetical protein
MLFVRNVLSVNLTVCEVQYNSTNPEAGYPDRLGPWGKFVENSTKLACLEITGNQITKGSESR